MKSYRNNNRRGRYRNNDRNFKRNGETSKFGSDFTSNSNFKRKVPGRNNYNASKLIEKYNDLAREAITNGDKILSENYLQHAEHFSRIITLQEISKETNISSPKSDQSNKENHKETDEVDQKNKSVDLNIND